MKKVNPLKSVKDIKKLKNYFYERNEYRNYLLVVICLNTALRISDVLNIKKTDLYDFSKNKCRQHLKIIEKKTGKEQVIYINKNIKDALKLYLKCDNSGFDYLFHSNIDKPISRVMVHKLLKKACEETDIPDISCHSLRKTFGYHAWKSGIQPAVIMSVYNHSSFDVTKRYLGIAQDDKDRVYKGVRL